jgi:hypothetical protein
MSISVGFVFEGQITTSLTINACHVVSGVNPFVLFNGEIDNGHCNTAAN